MYITSLHVLHFHRLQKTVISLYVSVDKKKIFRLVSKTLVFVLKNIILKKYFLFFVSLTEKILPSMAMLCEIPKSCMYKGNFLSYKKILDSFQNLFRCWLDFMEILYVFFGAGIFLK